ncbi:MAG TPA: hypothetical protein VF533_12415, partial [Solirubrobacteraceae bacterium]
MRARGVAAGLAAAALLAGAPAASAGTNLAAGPDATVAVAWLQGEQVHERTLGPSGAFGPAQGVSWASRRAFDQAIGADANGGAVIAWTGDDAGTHAAYARGRAPDGALSAVQRVSPAGVSVSRLQLAVAPDGGAVAVWQRPLSGATVVQARRRRADGTLGPVHTLAPTTGQADGPAVAVAPDGAATVAWTRALSKDDQFVETRTVAPDETVSAIQRLNAAGTVADGPEVTVDGAGTAVFAYRRTPGGAAVAELRSRSATGALGARQTVSGAA